MLREQLGEQEAAHYFWRGGKIVTLLLMVCDRQLGGRVSGHSCCSLVSFAALPSLAIPVSCHGAKVEVIKALDHYLKPRSGIQSSAVIGADLLEKLVVSPSNLVFGRIDVFSTVEHLVMRLRGATEEDWMQQCPTLLRVNILFSFVYFSILFLPFFIFP